MSVFHSLSLHSKCILVLGIFHWKCKDAHINFYRLKLLVLQTNKNTDQPSTRAESADSNLLKWFFLKEIEFCALERSGRPRVTCFHQQEDGIKCRRYHLCSEWKCEQTANFPVHLSLLNLTMDWVTKWNHNKKLATKLDSGKWLQESEIWCGLSNCI